MAANSLDISGDRDFALESVFVLSLIAHCRKSGSCGVQAGNHSFIHLPQEFCTGSSIMPQKINPDVLELTRGKTARVIGKRYWCS
ncbi:MAG: lyase family protein [Pirellulales bacterium]